MSQIPDALKSKLAEDAARTEVLMAYAAMPNTYSGSIILKDLRASLGGASYLPGEDALTMAYREGRRSVLLSIEALIAEGQARTENLGATRPDLQAQAEQEDIFS